MFSKLNQVKTLQRGSLSQIRLENLLRIAEEGPAIERYDVTPAMKIWANEKVRRPKQTELYFHTKLLFSMKNAKIKNVN